MEDRAAAKVQFRYVEFYTLPLSKPRGYKIFLIVQFSSVEYETLKALSS